MQVREYRAIDLNMTDEERRNLVTRCRNGLVPLHIILRGCMMANAGFAEYIFTHLTIGLSYDQMENKNHQPPIYRQDFYCYVKIATAYINAKINGVPFERIREKNRRKKTAKR